MGKAKWSSKVTARNNLFLAGVKRMMNGKIFAKVSAVVNEDGEEAGLAYLQQYFRIPVTIEFFVNFEGFKGNQ